MAIQMPTAPELVPPAAPSRVRLTW